MDEGASRGSATRTVLFTDVVGSTARRSRLGDAAADSLEREHDELLQAVVARHTGTVVKGTGDGIMAVFDSAAQAAACAVAIQQALERRGRRGGEALEVRIGLSAGDVGWERGDYFGMPVNQAARLEAAARGGQILASDLVRLLAGSRAAVDFRAVEPLSLKGLPEPLSACEIPWEPLVVELPPLPPGLVAAQRLPFVGREAELAQLEKLWRRAAAGERQVAFLAGEPGIGKTRLAAEVAQRARADDARVLYGRCEEDLGVPYQPFVEALRQFVVATPDHELRARLGRYPGELVRVLPELGERFGDLPPPPPASDPETGRYRLFEAFASWLAAASQEDPLLLVLDDLHWAATPTLLLLRHVIASPETSFVFVVGTYRDTETERGDTLSEFLADQWRGAPVERLSLGGLGAEDVTELLGTVGSDVRHQRDQLARALHTETEGNPFYISEVIRHMRDSGYGPERVGVPQSVREVVGRRLARLSEQANRTLQLASVVGQHFDLDVLEAAGGDATLDALEEAAGARVVLEVEASRYRFAHAIVRSVVYDGLGAARCARLHRRAGEAIEKCRAARLDEHLPALAHHFAQAVSAGGEAKAIDYAIRAGDAAFGAFAFEQAALFFHQALELAEGGSVQPPGYIDLLLGLGWSRMAAGDIPGTRDAALRAAGASRRAGSAVSLARAAILFASWSNTVSSGEEELLEEALAALGASEPSLRAQLLGRLSYSRSYSGGGIGVGSLAEEAIRLAELADDREALGQALNGRVATLWGSERVGDRLAVIHREERVAAESRASGTALGRIRAVGWRLWRDELLLLVKRAATHLELGDAERFRDDVEELRSLEQHSPWYSRANRAALEVVVALMQGRFDDAEPLMTTMLDEGRAVFGFVSAYDAQLFALRREQGRSAEMKLLVANSMSIDPTIATLRAMSALTDVESCDREAAAESLGRLSKDDFATVPRDLTWTLSLSLLSEVCAELDDAGRAGSLFTLLTPHQGHMVVLGNLLCIGAVDRFLGMLAATMQRWDEAEVHFEAALVLEERMHALPFLARTRYWYARMLLARDREPDKPRAMQLLRHAVETAGALGMRKLAADSVALL